MSDRSEGDWDTGGETRERAILVTGSSGGIGRAVATAFAENGDRVAIHYRGNRDAAEQLSKELPGDGHLLVQADVTDPDAVQAMVDQVVDAFGGIDVLVNNAGHATPHPILETDYEQWRTAWRTIIDLNLVATANVTWCAVRHMDTGARIVNMSSVGAFSGTEPPAYGASKGALNSLTYILARDLGRRGIGVTGVAPGWVETELAAPVLDSPQGDVLRAQSPFGRVGRPDEVAAAVLYLASPQAEWASGAVLDLNGAFLFRA
ncbi:SDR family NAD(P)-dependent oxidoreductase [Nocardia pseudobrasiliensis]|uniref:NAD(P)-dependent dehydrogenase (Short-subunit alcohol dehydrogenase family) n=1 Tax=Nocardia pseudobrasiliensis TaxID=45979 RepID=A0A370IG11_9NOCA|nr:SDR family oxidoreductase [Nocardia pseudobrasiliensis]RDI68394.1 NAD(P)-dependent dehydrogenase (short-subunit alcohol dehydrogenase family) [Nocardia pseudobrasiliensis]